MPVAVRGVARRTACARVPGAAAAAAALALGPVACFSYRPVALREVAPGADVRLRLTNEGTSSLARFLGPRVVGVDGRLVRRGDDSVLAVSVEMVETADRVRQPWTGEAPVEVPASVVVTIQRRTLDRRRTYLALGASAVALVSAGVIAGTSVGGGGPGTPPPPPPP